MRRATALFGQAASATTRLSRSCELGLLAPLSIAPVYRLLDAREVPWILRASGAILGFHEDMRSPCLDPGVIQGGTSRRGVVMRDHPFDPCRIPPDPGAPRVEHRVLMPIG